MMHDNIMYGHSLQIPRGFLTRPINPVMIYTCYIYNMVSDGGLGRFDDSRHQTHGLAPFNPIQHFATLLAALVLL